MPHRCRIRRAVVRRRRQGTITRGRAAVGVGTLGGRGWFADRTVVATSATLTLGGTFDRHRGGPWALRKENEHTGTEQPADGNSGPMWRGLDVGSPFDYRKQGIGLVRRPRTSRGRPHRGCRTPPPTSS